MKVLLYSFKSFPYLKSLEELGLELFIFGKLKEDLKILKKKVVHEKPDLILGIAKSTLEKSTIEAFTINKFNKGKVSPNSIIDSYELFLPQDLPEFLKIRKTPTTTFCNWTMFKLSEFLEQEKLDIKLSFLHISEKDLDQVKGFLKTF